MMLVLLASVLLAAAGAGAAQNDMTESAATSILPDRKAFEDELKFSAEGETLRAIERHYPAEYRALIDAIYTDAAAHPQDRAARAASEKRLFDAFYRRHAPDLAKAPAALLAAINGRQLALARRLARDDPKLCADFASGLFVGRSDLPATYQSEAAALLAAIVEAAKAGEGQAPDPRRQSLGVEDAAPFYEQLLRIEPTGQVQAAIAAESGEGGGTPEMQCRIGAAIYASIDKLQEEQAANVAAYFLTQTLTGAN
jgi:hypothetical protein